MKCQGPSQLQKLAEAVWQDLFDGVAAGGGLGWGGVWGLGVSWIP